MINYTTLHLLFFFPSIHQSSLEQFYIYRDFSYSPAVTIQQDTNGDKLQEERQTDRLFDRLNQFVDLTIIFINSVSLLLIVWVWLPSCLQVNLHQNYSHQLVSIFINYTCWGRKKKTKNVAISFIPAAAELFSKAAQGQAVWSHSDLRRPVLPWCRRMLSLLALISACTDGQLAALALLAHSWRHWGE